MSYLSDLGEDEIKRNTGAGKSEVTFLASNHEKDNLRLYWTNALDLLNQFIIKENPGAIGLQELNCTDVTSDTGSNAIKKMLSTIIDDDDGTAYYKLVCKSVKAYGTNVGIGIIVNTKIFGDINDTKCNVFDNTKQNGRPLLIVVTEKNYVFISAHGAQDPKVLSEVTDDGKKKTIETMKAFNNSIRTLNVKHIQETVTNHLSTHEIIPAELFLMGDLNDRFDAITSFDIGGLHLKYNGKAPKSCCHNWDSSCSDDRYNQFGDTEYGHCNQPDNIMYEGEEKKKFKRPMNDEEGYTKNYRYRGDKVFGENPISDIEIFTGTDTEYISTKSDHQLVYAKFGYNYTTIDWVRHAESVANWANFKQTDTYNTNDLKDKLKFEVQKFHALEHMEVEDMKKTFPQVKQVYDLIDNLIKNDKDNKDKDNVVLRTLCPTPKYPIISNKEDVINGTVTQETLNAVWKFDGKDIVNTSCIEKLNKLYNDNKLFDTIRQTRYAYWLRHMITTNFLFQPTLTHVGLLQAKKLGEHLATQSIQYDLVLSSATVRTLMTAYIALMNCKSAVLTKKIVIVPYTNEDENDAKYVFNGQDGLHDFCNAALHPNAIEQVCELIKNYLDKKAETVANTNDILFDFSKYVALAKGKSEKEIDEIRSCNIAKFWTYAGEQSLFSNKKRVLSFCHGRVINELREKAKIATKVLYETNCAKDHDFATFTTNASIFRHSINEKKDVVKDVVKYDVVEYDDKNLKYIKDEELCKNTELFEKSLKDIGLVYSPKKIRSNTFNDEDTVTLDDDLMLLQEGSLRYDIAKITHKYCKNGSYYKNGNKWKKLNKEHEHLPECIIPGGGGGRRTRKKQGVKGKKVRTRRHPIRAKKISRKKGRNNKKRKTKAMKK